MYLGIERRANPRNLITTQGVIWRDDPYSIVLCTVLDVSPAGAGLLLPASVSPIPPEFDLTFDRVTYRCIALWQRRDRMGLRFTYQSSRATNHPLPSRARGEGEGSQVIDAMAGQGWAMAQRVGMRIAELPIKARELAFAGTERCLRQAGNELGVVGQQLDRIVGLQMRAIRQIVTDIDVGGNQQGGRA
jgi:hypothetical protein